jgi:outer membrane protein assembly factor BamB
VAEGAVYFGCDDGHLYALQIATGKELWKFKTGGAIESSPCLADGAVYVGSDDACLYAIH